MKTLEQVMEGVTAGGKWRVADRPGRGTQIEWGPEGGDVERPVCHMRWTDGLNTRVEAAVAADATYAARACSNFPALVKALDKTNNAIEAGDYWHSGHCAIIDQGPCNCWVADVKAALAEALKD